VIRRTLKKSRLLTRPTPAVISPSRPESAKTDSSPWDAPCPKQGRNSVADSRFAFHASRFTVPGSEARTKLAGFFSVLLGAAVERERPNRRVVTRAIDFDGEVGAGG
jgi:hypothetical protein